MKIKKEINIFANTMVEPGLSGGNRIFIELAKQWTKKGIVINIFTSSVGKQICEENNLLNANIFTWNIPKTFRTKYPLSRLKIFFLYIYGIIYGFKIYPYSKKGKGQVIWTTSDYWPDSLFGIFAKLKNKNVFWIGSLFLFAPNPFIGFVEKGKFSLPTIKNLLFYISQRPIIYLIKKMSNLIFVTSQPDKDRFIKEGRCEQSIVVIKGGVDTKFADDYFKNKTKSRKIYDACFVGRFHPQKGVLELVDIWEEVCKIKKNALLVMVGHGELENAVKEKIKKKKLNQNILLKGFLGDGKEKFEIFKKSRIILHPSVYDSGGMAAAEGMSWGLPGVSFDLEALKTYYPYGMLKAKINNINDFSRLILELLQNNKLYCNTAKKARELILKDWNWKNKAEDLKKILYY